MTRALNYTSQQENNTEDKETFSNRLCLYLLNLIFVIFFILFHFLKYPCAAARVNNKILEVEIILVDVVISVVYNISFTVSDLPVLPTELS